MNDLRSDPMFADVQLDDALHDAFLAHLIERVRRGEASVEGQTIRGVFGVCQPTGEPTFTPTPEQGHDSIPAPLGQAVELCFHHDSNPSWFDSRVIAVNPEGVWRLQRPSAVTTATRRLVPRLRCGPREGLPLQFEVIEGRGSVGSLQLGDISPDGLGLVFDQRRSSIVKGQRLEGWLSLPGHDVLRVELDVVSVTLVYPGSSLRRASARFASIPLEERRSLARKLADLTGQHGTLDHVAAK
jgi:hypothetical protein